jgi:N-acetyl-1-D-myo-inositol-2-amino-2-deoxy-alpha-D-glucopyranoside deacetylase
MQLSRAVSGEALTPARLLFVHAHPDDETLTTGVTMAAYASRGHDVHLLTCTLGEEGEVIPQALAHLGFNREDTLGSWRREELRAAMSVLGVAHSVLGEDPDRGIASRYRDSGMAGTASAERPDAFVHADLCEAAAMVAAHIRTLRPDVVVTYDEQGGYAHPDHIQTHRVTMAALSLLTAEAGAETEADARRTAVPVAYCILTPRSWAWQDRAWLRDNVVLNDRDDDGVSTEGVAPTSASCVVLPQDAPYPPSVVSDEIVTHVVEEPALVEVQSQALAQHSSQVSVYEGYYALSNRIAARLSGREGFARFDPVAGHLVPAAHGAPRHTGLLNDPQPLNDSQLLTDQGGG